MIKQLIRSACCVACLAVWIGGLGAQEFPPPPVPAENPLTEAKVMLGKALFWEEQLSVTGTVACGTCHRPSNGGSDPRAVGGGIATTHPGPDGVRGNADDVVGSAGVPLHTEDGHYVWNVEFGIQPRVGHRRAPTVFGAAYASRLLRDGRAGPSFADPLTGQLVVPSGASLEDQALKPLLDINEMGTVDGSIAVVPARIADVQPLALAEQVPAALKLWVGTRRYPELFQTAFGTPVITPTRIALAIASYLRTLNPTRTPLDAEVATGAGQFTPQESEGFALYRNSLRISCAACHGSEGMPPPDLFAVSVDFQNTGVRPDEDDLGRFLVTNDPTDRGKFRIPNLRNVEQRAPFMRNGRFSSLEQVIDFYDRGGDFASPNHAVSVSPMGLTNSEKAALVAFLRRPMSDPRIALEQPPFDRPKLYTESSHRPQITGSGIAGGGALVPQMVALEPPLLGNTNFTVGVWNALGGAQATLVVDHTDPGIQAIVPLGDFANLPITLGGVGFGKGFGTAQVALPADAAGQRLFGRFYVVDPSAAAGLAITPAFEITIFGGGAEFANGFE